MLPPTCPPRAAFTTIHPLIDGVVAWATTVRHHSAGVCVDSARVTTYRALIDGGRSRGQVGSLVDDGSLLVLRRGVYADAGSCNQVRTAALHGGSIACVTAARHAGLWTLAPDDTIHVWLRGHGHGRRHDTCRCATHWDDAPESGEVARDAFGLPSIPRLLRQIYLCRGIEEFFISLESALHTRKIAPEDLIWLKENCGDAVRDAIAFARSDAESGLESLLRWRLRSLNVRFRTQVAIPGVGRVDFLLGDRLIIEVDGAPNHDGPSHRHKDLVRDAGAATWGYVTLRFDYAMVVHDWATVEAAIRSSIEHGRHR